MQRPTLENARVRSTRVALHIFNAVARNVLPLITRRLDADERRAIVCLTSSLSLALLSKRRSQCAGNVYVWEERGAASENVGIGMERW
jgi:Gti1/Pac2 family transcription factor